MQNCFSFTVYPKMFKLGWLLVLYFGCDLAATQPFNETSYEDGDFFAHPLLDDLFDVPPKQNGDTAIAAVYVVLTVAGLIANAVVLFVIFCGNEITKTVTAIYVVQLAIADCALLIVLPLFAIQHLNHHWDFGSAICTLCQTVKTVNYYAGIFFLTAMSIDRYIAVVYSTKARQIRTITRTLLVCAGVWIASILASLPVLMYAKTDDVEDDHVCRIMFPGHQTPNDTAFNLIVWDEDEDDLELLYDENGDTTTYVNYSDEFEINYEIENDTDTVVCKRELQPYASMVYDIFRFVVGYVLPFVVITVSYFLILSKLKKSEERLTNTHVNSSSQSNSIRHKVTLMVIALVICFGLCWLPYQVYTMLMIKGFSIFSDPILCYQLETYTAIIGYSNSVFNPILYTFLGQNFRKRLSDSWKKTRSRMQNGSRIVTNGHWRNTNKFQTASLSKRFSGLHFSRVQPAKNEQASTGFTSVFTDNEKDGKKTALLEFQPVKKPLLKHSIEKEGSAAQRNSL